MRGTGRVLDYVRGNYRGAQAAGLQFPSARREHCCIAHFCFPRNPLSSARGRRVQASGLRSPEFHKRTSGDIIIHYFPAGRRKMHANQRSPRQYCPTDANACGPEVLSSRYVVRDECVRAPADHHEKQKKPDLSTRLFFDWSYSVIRLPARSR